MDGSISPSCLCTIDLERCVWRLRRGLIRYRNVANSAQKGRWCASDPLEGRPEVSDNRSVSGQEERAFRTAPLSPPTSPEAPTSPVHLAHGFSRRRVGKLEEERGMHISSLPVRKCGVRVGEAVKSTRDPLHLRGRRGLKQATSPSQEPRL